ncbi:unnamed protein product [Chrysodeixis includens]|uniref:Tektin n=1 Tax=Chrysodeixis includens TaxID=689277 RepID=A0A9P0BW60_CHRIL|nr:unnamed protein product [Chrysodeixis includens]
MATISHTYQELDICPNTCADVGAFVKSKVNPLDVVEEQRTARDDKLANLKSIAGPKPSEEPPPTEDVVEGPVHVSEHPQLKPGIDGKVDWTPLGKLTGTRPGVSKYSLSRYSLGEWREHNNKVLNSDIVTKSNIIDYNAKTAMMQAFGNIDKQQMENNKRLKQKAKDIYRWKSEVERACREITDEVELLEVERQRLKGASRVLMLPESISKECLELRSNRMKTDLVADLADIELVKEMKLVIEVRGTLKATLDNIEEQLKIAKAAKHRIEFDWCDKTMAYNTEATNLSLTPKSATLMFRPGATRFGENTAPLEYWEYFCRENIQNCEAVRQKSSDLRGTLNSILISNGRKLRIQADKTDMALAETVALTSELCTKLEQNLTNTLYKIADVEKLIQNLHDAVTKTDAAMKLAQTRLDNRNNWRPHGESVRDQPHLGLIEEVKKIHETVTSLLGQLRTAEAARTELMDKRKQLERDIAAKRKTLNIDRERCGMVRSHYPSALELAGC